MLENSASQLRALARICTLTVAVRFLGRPLANPARALQALATAAPAECIAICTRCVSGFLTRRPLLSDETLCPGKESCPSCTALLACRTIAGADP